MESLKKVAILVVFVVAGYFLVQFVMGDSEYEGYEEEETISADSLPEIPEGCTSSVENLEKAIYGHQTGRASAAQKSKAYGKLMSCLSDAGFSDAEVRGTIEQIENKIRGYLEQDGEM